MAEVQIDLEGRQLVNKIIKEQTATRIVTLDVYNDGTEVEYIHEAGDVSISSNRTLGIQPDGKTVKLV